MSAPTSDGLDERLFHVSDRAGIDVFHPRPPPSADSGVAQPVVWAIADRLLHNYLLPRDCPRVTCHAVQGHDVADAALDFVSSGARALVAIESAWWPAVRAGRLWIYEMPRMSFQCADVTAAYYISRDTVTPLCVQAVDDIPAALLARGVELRVLPTLWPLADRVRHSALPFSLIRMRNAAPRRAVESV